MECPRDHRIEHLLHFSCEAVYIAKSTVADLEVLRIVNIEYLTKCQNITQGLLCNL